jgi:hypothetical protein
MLLEFQLKRKESAVSITLVNIGGYRICCQVDAEERMVLRPKKRKSSVGLGWHISS